MNSEDDTFRVLSRPPFEIVLKIYKDWADSHDPDWDPMVTEMHNLGWPQEEFEAEYLRRYGRW